MKSPETLCIRVFPTFLTDNIYLYNLLIVFLLCQFYCGNWLDGLKWGKIRSDVCLLSSKCQVFWRDFLKVVKLWGLKMSNNQIFLMLYNSHWILSVWKKNQYGSSESIHSQARVQKNPQISHLIHVQVLIWNSCKKFHKYAFFVRRRRATWLHGESGHSQALWSESHFCFSHFSFYFNPFPWNFPSSQASWVSGRSFSLTSI